MIRLWRDLGVLQPNDEPEKCRDLFQNTEEVDRKLRNISAHSKTSQKKFFQAGRSSRLSIRWHMSRALGRGLSSKGSGLTTVHKDLVGNKDIGGGASWGDESRTNFEVR